MDESYACPQDWVTEPSCPLDNRGAALGKVLASCERKPTFLSAERRLQAAQPRHCVSLPVPHALVAPERQAGALHLLGWGDPTQPSAGGARPWVGVGLPLTSRPGGPAWLPHPVHSLHPLHMQRECLCVILFVFISVIPLLFAQLLSDCCLKVSQDNCRTPA